MSIRKSTDQSNWLRVFAVGALLAVCGGLWLSKVNSTVQDPYLDEEFHVRQAQLYCSGDLRTWDPKITTPPGLYLVSWFIYRLTGRCSIEDLRALNVFTIIIGYLYTYGILRSLRKTSRIPSQTLQDSWALTALNIWLFPPLFFFSGLYYTDLQSALWVILAFQSYLRYERNGFQSWGDAFSQFKFGIIALFFRQTNIFWIAVLPAGLAVVASAQQSGQKSKQNVLTGLGFLAVCERSWTNLELYDPNVYDARIQDYFKAVASLAIVSTRNWKNIIPIVIPYISLIACFGGFVVWNGGVVLGDKSNHVATIHLPQMLYLWPYMLFFSWPIVMQAFLQGNIKVCKTWSQIALKVLLLGTMTVLAMGVIHYNTIVHPFTLADNRHYVFYVFRILMRHPAIKYLAAPIYIGSGYLVLQAMGSKVHDTGCKASFVLVWLITTTLSLITAPLVEPRYCIIPWMMWRLHVHTEDYPLELTSKDEKVSAAQTSNVLSLVIESLWFSAIFAGTAYMFLFRGFTWPQEPGKTQRFLW